MKVPAEVTREELEAAFPWVCHLPPDAIGEFLAAIEIYRRAAEIYSGKREPNAFDYLAEAWAASLREESRDGTKPAA